MKVHILSDLHLEFASFEVHSLGDTRIISTLRGYLGEMVATFRSALVVEV